MILRRFQQGSTELLEIIAATDVSDKIKLSGARLAFAKLIVDIGKLTRGMEADQTNHE
jgi:hypothetical protein